MITSAPTRALAKYFKKAREESSISQWELAQLLGYSSPQMISNWERNLCNPPLKAVYKMIELFKLNKKEVLIHVMQESKSKTLMALAGNALDPKSKRKLKS